MADPKIVVIAGPNGAGKTTFARAFLPQEAQVLRFINADLIAAGLSPFAPEAAAIHPAGYDNFDRRYRQAVDAWALYDNSGDEPTLIDWGEAP